MTEPRNEQSVDLVSRAVSATRQLSLPDGPSTAVMSQTLAALREAECRPRATLRERIYHMSLPSKAIAVLATAATLLAMYLGLANLSGGGLAFAEVVAALNNVRSATWKFTYTFKGPQNQSFEQTGIGMFLEPSHERTEATAKGATVIQISDGQKDQSITLVPTMKTAMIINFKNRSDQVFLGKTFLNLRKLASQAQDGEAEQVERMGIEMIDGQRAQGFRLQTGAVEIKVWADPETLLPIRVESATSVPGGPEGHIVMTDFQVNVDLDPDLFSVEVPERYTVRQTTDVDVSKKPIAYVADMLRMAAKQNNGVFPSTLDMEVLQRIEQGAREAIAQKDPNASEAHELQLDVTMKLAAAYAFLFTLSAEENDWHYAGKEVKLDTPNQPIFWYRASKMSDTYEVLYADLSIQEIPAEEAPQAGASDDSP